MKKYSRPRIIHKTNEGVWHKSDGPAIIRVDGSKVWYLLDQRISKKIFNSWLNRIRAVRKWIDINKRIIKKRKALYKNNLI